MTAWDFAYRDCFAGNGVENWLVGMETTVSTNETERRLDLVEKCLNQFVLAGMRHEELKLMLALVDRELAHNLDALHLEVFETLLCVYLGVRNPLLASSSIRLHLFLRPPCHASTSTSLGPRVALSPRYHFSERSATSAQPRARNRERRTGRLWDEGDCLQVA